jgi:hypothetical protein
VLCEVGMNGSELKVSLYRKSTPYGKIMVRQEMELKDMDTVKQNDRDRLEIKVTQEMESKDMGAVKQNDRG